MEGKKKWNWTVVLCAVLLGANLWQLQRIFDLERTVWSALNNIEYNIRNIDQRLSSLSSELESANDLVRDWSYATAVNKEKRCLDVEVSVILKEWQAGTAATLLWVNEYGNGGEGLLPLSGSGAGSFAGTLKLPLSSLSGGYSLDVVIENGETQRRESLGYLGDMSQLLPIQYNGWGMGMSSYRQGVFTASGCDVEVYAPSGAAPEIENAVFRLTKNGEVVEERTAMQGDRMGSYVCLEEWSAECQAGDELMMTFFCRDRDGLGYEFFMEGWRITEEGAPEDLAPVRDWPKLTWN